jgi:predicted adenylyl cyclase CyaB
MGKEFEAKVLLTPDEYINILEQEIYTLGIKKSDIYYSKYLSTEEAIKNGESLTRIRTEGDTAYLTLKKKESTNGFENNKEYETQIKDVEVVKNLLLEAGYSPYFKKYKTSHTISISPPPISIPGVEVHVELEKVENSKHTEKSTYKKVYALEIETVVSAGLDIRTEELAEIVKTYFNYFNKTERDFETKSWRELLG